MSSFWTSLGSPKIVLGPMVDQSELAFRMMTRHHGVQLAYTPMFHARLFSECEDYRRKHFTSCAKDRPLIAQFSGNDGATIATAAKHLIGEVDGIDLNFGCPQHIARRGNYGAFLLDKPDLMVNIVKDIKKSLNLPVTCKIRKVDADDRAKTLDLTRRLEEAGCAAICVHGRTKDEKGPMAKDCDWELIREIKKAANIPIIANGGVENYDDAMRCLQYTGADAVMSAEALLGNPAVFDRSYKGSTTDLASEYLEYCDKYGEDRPSVIKAHLFHILHARLTEDTAARQLLSDVRKLNMVDLCTSCP
eukprot:Lankesteria_metandrocarpae@DN3564_c0_g1_i2.p1